MTDPLAIPLPTGTLHVTLAPGRIPIRRLLGFAARIGSKRKFLLVSKVLGKHYPVTPRMMAWSYRALARIAIGAGLTGDSLWIGMAETATGLGYGVFAAAYELGVENALFMQTTRYHLSGGDYLAFDEAHSHATDFFLYYPEQPDTRQRFLSAETLVLIDDEISTGRTFLRLIEAYRAVNPGLRKVLIVSLVNFAHADDRALLTSATGVDVTWLCLRQGLLRFDDAGNAALDAVSVHVSSNGECKRHRLAWPGRLGMTTPVALTDATVAAAMQHLPQAKDSQRRPVLVLGTGECNAPAYLLGRALELNGVAVKVQSTTRSPIHLGNDIQHICRFEDNYGDGIANFVYNLNTDAYCAIIVCHETPPCPPLLERLHAWQAIGARFEPTPDPRDATLHFFRP